MLFRTSTTPSTSSSMHVSTIHLASITLPTTMYPSTPCCSLKSSPSKPLSDLNGTASLHPSRRPPPRLHHDPHMHHHEQPKLHLQRIYCTSTTAAPPRATLASFNQRSTATSWERKMLSRATPPQAPPRRATISNTKKPLQQQHPRATSFHAPPQLGFALMTP